MNQKRPCERACQDQGHQHEQRRPSPQRISTTRSASPAAPCVYQCPFGAIVDKSFILDAVDLLKKSRDNEDYKVYAVVAPSISSQFSYAKLGQVINRHPAPRLLPCHRGCARRRHGRFIRRPRSVRRKGLPLTSSCCPAFVSYIKKSFPSLADKISHNLSPAAEIARYIKETTPNAKIVFIGPCTAKKMEFKYERAAEYIDCTLTFEELQALFDSRDIDLTTLPEGVLDNASYYGRIFARSGGLTDAVTRGAAGAGQHRLQAQSHCLRRH